MAHSQITDIQQTDPTSIHHLLHPKVEMLTTMVDAYFSRRSQNGSTPFPHLLLLGDERGLGRRTVCSVIAREMGVPMVEHIGYTISLGGQDVYEVVANVPEGGVLFLNSGIGTLSTHTQVVLYEALTTKKIHVPTSPHSNETRTVDIPQYTVVISAGTKAVIEPLRRLFIPILFGPYSEDMLTEIVKRRLRGIHVEASDEVVHELVHLAKGNCGTAMSLLTLMLNILHAEGRNIVELKDVKRAKEWYHGNVPIGTKKESTVG